MLQKMIMEFTIIYGLRHNINNNEEKRLWASEGVIYNGDGKGERHLGSIIYQKVIDALGSFNLQSDPMVFPVIVF